MFLSCKKSDYTRFVIWFSSLLCSSVKAFGTARGAANGVILEIVLGVKNQILIEK